MSTEKEAHNQVHEIPMPYPEKLFEWSKEELDNIKFQGPCTDIPARLVHKCFQFWVLWSNLRNSEELIKIINEKSEKDSHDYKLKLYMIQTIDKIGKILCNTNIVQELAFRSAVICPKCNEDRKVMCPYCKEKFMN
jgi:hypothetical protein